MKNEVYELEYYNHRRINNTLILGFLIRLFFLLLVLFVFSESTEIFMFTDDAKYEMLALNYINNANTLIDKNAFKSAGGFGYLQAFWPWVMCISSFILKTEYAGRILNIILSTIIIRIVFNLTLYVSWNERTALQAAKMYAYFPATVLFCCFPFKDVFITLVVFFTFESIVIRQKFKAINKNRVVINILLLACLYYSRGAVTEIMVAFILGLLLYEYAKEKKYTSMLFATIAILICIYLFSQSVYSAFTMKVNDYFFTDYARNIGTTIALIRIDSIMQIWKLPFAYAYSLLNPFTLNIFSFYPNETVWAHFAAIGNMVVFPIAIGNIIYVVKRKKNYYLWFTSLLMYLAVIVMSLGISRHYFFLYPMELINYSLFYEESNKGERRIVRWGSALMLSFVLIISIMRLY